MTPAIPIPMYNGNGTRPRACGSTRSRLPVAALTVLAGLALPCAAGGATAGDALRSNLDAATFDASASYALPGKTPPSPGVLRIGKIANHVEWWRTRPGRSAGQVHFVLAFKEPAQVGTVLAYGPWQVSYLQGAADPQAADEGQWQPVPYPGATDRQLRVVPLPPGTRTRAIRLSGPLAPNDSGEFTAALGFATMGAASTSARWTPCTR